MMLAERTGLEPATPGVTGRYSNQLNYRSAAVKLFSWWALTESNRRHSACKADALPTELSALSKRGRIKTCRPKLVNTCGRFFYKIFKKAQNAAVVSGFGQTLAVSGRFTCYSISVEGNAGYNYSEGNETSSSFVCHTMGVGCEISH